MTDYHGKTDTEILVNIRDECKEINRWIEGGTSKLDSILRALLAQNAAMAEMLLKYLIEP